MSEKMYVGDFLKMVKDLEEATDKHGVRLYDDKAIASFFGFETETTLKTEVSKAREYYRTELQNDACGLKERGYSEEDIAKTMGISEETVNALLNAKGKRRAESIKNLEKKRQEMFKKIDEDFQKQQKEQQDLFKKLGIKDPLGFGW